MLAEQLTLTLARSTLLPITKPSPSFITFVASALPFAASKFTFAVSAAAFKPFAFIAEVVAFILSTSTIVVKVMRWVTPCSLAIILFRLVAEQALLPSA